MPAQFEKSTVKASPADAANALLESTGVSKQTAVDLVKFLRNPASASSTYRGQYRKARRQFAEPDDTGVEWAERFAAYQADAPSAFARPSFADGTGPREKLRGSSDLVEKDSADIGSEDVWTDSPFAMG
jgi:hypothetical protein